MTTTDTLTADDSVPARADDVIVRAFDDGSALAWGHHHLPAVLDPVHHVLLQLVDGEGSVADLVTDVHEVIGIPESIARDRIHTALEQFASYGLLAGHEGAISLDRLADPDFLLGPPNN